MQLGRGAMLIYMLSVLMVFMIIIVGLTDGNSYRNQVSQYVFIFAMFVTLAIFWGLVLT